MMSYIIMPAAAKRIDEILGYVHEPNMQDWDLERADARMLDTWIGIIDEVKLSDEEKSAFFALVVASYDDTLYQKGNESDLMVEEWICDQVNRSQGRYSDIINYWKSYGSSEPEVGKVSRVFERC